MLDIFAILNLGSKGLFRENKGLNLTLMMDLQKWSLI
jgi:hypothetical protein